MDRSGKTKSEWRVALAGAQNWRCAHCGGVMRYNPGSPDSATIEHVIPLANGGLRVWGNEVSAHQACNGRRGSQPVDRISRMIAVELMGGEYAAQRTSALLSAKNAPLRAAQMLEEERAALSRYCDDEGAAVIHHRLLLAARAIREIVDGPPPPLPPAYLLRPRIAASVLVRRSAMVVAWVKRSSARLRVLCVALAAGWRAKLPEDGDGMAITIAPASQVARDKAEWQSLWGKSYRTHTSQKPRKQTTADWEARFFKDNPEARTHPGCPSLGGVGRVK